jgi:hypothetical protein
MNMFLKTHIAKQIIGDTTSSLQSLNKEFLLIAKDYKEVKALKSTQDEVQDVTLEITKIFTRLVKFEDKITNSDSYRKLCDLHFQSELMHSAELHSEKHTTEEKTDEYVKDIEIQSLRAELANRDKEVEALQKDYDEEKQSLKKLIRDVETKGEVLTSDLADMKKKLFQVANIRALTQKTPSPKEEMKYERSPSAKTRK